MRLPHSYVPIGWLVEQKVWTGNWAELRRIAVPAALRRRTDQIRCYFFYPTRATRFVAPLKRLTRRNGCDLVCVGFRAFPHSRRAALSRISTGCRVSTRRSSRRFTSARLMSSVYPASYSGHSLRFAARALASSELADCNLLSVQTDWS